MKNLCIAIKECLPCNEFPLINHSEEKPDPATCFGIRHFEIYPRLGRTWETADCLELCVNVATDACQIEADFCAQVKALNCTESFGGVGGSGEVNPNDAPHELNPCGVNFGNAANGSLAGALPANVKRFVRFTTPNDLTVVDSLSFELNRTGTGAGYAVSAGIYTDTAGAPDALVANSYISVATDVKRDAAMWYTATYATTKPKLTGGVAYWIGIIAAQPVITFHDAGASNQQASAVDNYFDGLSNPFGGATFESLLMSAYVCYRTGFYNERQCAPPDLCPDGSSFTFCVEADTIPGTSVAAANTLALSLAIEQARLRKICLSEILQVCCLGQVYNQAITATGASVAAPNVNLWQLIGGVLPPGLLFSGGQIPGSASISGVATTAGTYPFSIKITAANGAAVTKNYTIDVMGILTSSSLPDAVPNVAYSTGLTAAGFSGVVTWALASGSLPTGLSLNAANGVISGTPTAIGDFVFTILASNGVTACSKTFSLASFTYSGIRINAWKTWCGYKTLLSEFSPNDCNGTTVGCPNPPATLVCDQRWLTRTERFTWAGGTYNNIPNPTPGPVNGSDDIYITRYKRYNCDAGEQVVSEEHRGSVIGDAYDEALACVTAGCGICPLGCGTAGRPSQRFEWNVLDLTADHFLVEIKFQINISEAIFIGYHEVTLSDPYTVKELQDDLKALWDSVDTTNYPWIDGTVDVFVTYDDNTVDAVTGKLHGYKPIQYSNNYPALALPVTDTSGGSTDRAQLHCALSDQYLVPPLQSGDTDYHAGFLIQPSACGIGVYPCVNLVKTVFRYRGLLCQTDFTRPLPVGSSVPCDVPALGDTCDKPWNTGTTTYLLPTTLVAFEVLPILAVLPISGEVYQPGVRKISQNCSLVDWWVMSELGLADRIGSKSLIALAPAESGGGTITDTVFGKITFGVELTSPITNELQSLSSAPNLPALAYSPLTSNGMTIAGWFKITNSVNEAADILTFSVVDGGQSIGFVITGGVATASVVGGAATGSMSIAFTPVAGTWYWFRIFYDNLNGLVGFQIDDGTIYVGAVSAQLPPVADNQVVLSLQGGTPGNITTGIFDEISVWQTNLSNDIATFLYNDGAGRTFPFV